MLLTPRLRNLGNNKTGETANIGSPSKPENKINIFRAYKKLEPDTL